MALVPRTPVSGGWPATLLLVLLCSALSMSTPAAAQWSPAPDMESSHIEHTATLIPSGKVLVVGDTRDYFAMAELYDIATGQWSRAESNSGTYWWGQTATLLIDGTVFLEGWRRLTWFPSDASKAARDKYEASVVRQLDMVVSRWSGWAVLKEIADIGRSRGKEVRIVPYTREDQNERGDENAFARPLSGRAAAPRAVTPYMGGVDDPSTPADERYQTVS